MDPIQIGEFATVTGAMMQSSTMEDHFGGASGAEFDALLAQPDSGQQGGIPCVELASEADTADEEREGFAPREVMAQPDWHRFEAVYAPFEWRLSSGTVGASEELAHAGRQDAGDHLKDSGSVSEGGETVADVPSTDEDARLLQTNPVSDGKFVAVQTIGSDVALFVSATPVPMQDFLSSPQSFPAVEQPAVHDTQRLAAQLLIAMGSLGEAGGSGAARSVQGIFTTDQQAVSGARSLPVISGPVMAASEAGAQHSAGQQRPDAEFDPSPTAPSSTESTQLLAQGAERTAETAVSAALSLPREGALAESSAQGVLSPAAPTHANTRGASKGPDQATPNPSKTVDAQEPDGIERISANVASHAGGIGRSVVEATREGRPVAPAEIAKVSDNPSPPVHSETREVGEATEDRAERTMPFGSEGPSRPDQSGPGMIAPIDGMVEVKPAGGESDDARWDLQPTLNAERRAMTEAPLTSPAHLADTSRADVARSVGQQIAAGIAMQADRPVELTLSPEELGRVRLTLQSAGDQTMVVSVQAERHDTLDLMRRHIDSLTREFREMGYSDVSFSFSQHSEQGRAQAGAPEPTAAETGAPTASERTIAQSLSAQLQPIRISLDSDGRGLDLRI